MADKFEFINYISKSLDKYNLSSDTIGFYTQYISDILSKYNLYLKNNFILNSRYKDYELLDLENKYTINSNLKYDFKNAMYIEYSLFTKYVNTLSSTYEKEYKDIILNMLNSILASFNLYNNLYNSIYNRNNLSRTEILCCKEFIILDNTLNLIVNSIKEEGNTLYLDGYILNMKTVPLSRLFNFYLELRDARGISFASKLFKNIDIAGNLGVYKGKKVFLPFLDNEYDLFGSDLSNVTWYYTYDFT